MTLTFSSTASEYAQSSQPIRVYRVDVDSPKAPFRPFGEIQDLRTQSHYGRNAQRREKDYFQVR